MNLSPPLASLPDESSLFDERNEQGITSYQLPSLRRSPRHAAKAKQEQTERSNRETALPRKIENHQAKSDRGKAPNYR